MLHTLRSAALVSLALASLAACHKSADEFENGPVTVRGEWRLAVSGGGITGKMNQVPAGQDIRIVFGPDSTYTCYYNGKVTETSFFQVRTLPGSAASPSQLQLLLKSTNSPSGVPFYRDNYITLLTTNKLNFMTGGGCPLISEYVRTKAAGSATNP